MRSFQILFSLSALALLGACATMEPEAAVNASAGLTDTAGRPTEASTSSVQAQSGSSSRNNRECREEAQTGSHFRTRRCISQREREEIRDQAQEWMRTGGNFGSTMIVN